MTGTMTTPSTTSRSSEPAPPQFRVSDSRPNSLSATWPAIAASSEAAIVTSTERTTCRLMSRPPGGSRLARSRK